MDTLETAVDPQLEAHLAATVEGRHASYLELLRIPSISTLSEHAPDCQRTAEWIVAELTRIGFDHAEASPTGGHPIVYADWLHAPDAPTVTATRETGTRNPYQSRICATMRSRSEFRPSASV